MFSFKARIFNLAVLPSRVLNRFIEWLFSSKIPAVVFIREQIRRNRVLRVTARFLIKSVRGLPHLFQNNVTFLRGAAYRRVRAIMHARSVGGRVTAAELERIWNECSKGRVVLCVADGLERKQLDIILNSVAARVFYYDDFAVGAGEALAPSTYEIVLLDESVPANKVYELDDDLFKKAHRIIRVGLNSRQSEYAKFQNAQLTLGKRTRGLSISDLLALRAPLRVVFLNDMGFQYGAGIALQRQVASFLLLGWEVSVLAWSPGSTVEAPKVTGVENFENWRGLRSLSPATGDRGDVQKANAEVIETVSSLSPDLVITGNLHGANWSLDVLKKISSLGIPVIAYMHDTYLITGRCAQPLACTLYRTGCDARCPTPHEHPSLPPEKIAPAWEARAAIFTGKNRTPLVGNSRWTRDMIVNRFGQAATTDFINLGLDHELFAPMEKYVARRLLKIPDGRPLIVMGSVDVQDRWKGGALFQGLFDKLVKREDVGVILFGRSSETLRCVKSFGVVQDPGLMPLILNAADIFVSTAIAESFGQTLLEASACALPVVAFNVGGVSDVIVHNETGILVESLSTQELNKAIDWLVANPSERARLGRNGRRRVEERFTLTKQGEAWIEYLKALR